jgi:hypothetical protein
VALPGRTADTPIFLTEFAVRVLFYVLAWYVAARGHPWVLAGLRPSKRRIATFVQARRRLMSGMCCSGAKGGPGVKPVDAAKADLVGDSAGELLVGPDGQETSPPPEPDADALLVLQSAEPYVQVFNLLAIAICPGMLSPIVAVGALLCFAAQHAVVTILHPSVFGQLGAEDSNPTTKGDDSDGDGSVAADGPSDYTYEAHPMPVVCLGLLLGVHSLYTAVALDTASFGAGAVGVILLNWVLLGGACWWCVRRDDPSGTAAASTLTPRADRGMLTELLLEPEPEWTGPPTAETAV